MIKVNFLYAFSYLNSFPSRNELTLRDTPEALTKLFGMLIMLFFYVELLWKAPLWLGSLVEMLLSNHFSISAFEFMKSAPISLFTSLQNKSEIVVSHWLLSPEISPFKHSARKVFEGRENLDGRENNPRLVPFLARPSLTISSASNIMSFPLQTPPKKAKAD